MSRLRSHTAALVAALSIAAGTVQAQAADDAAGADHEMPMLDFGRPCVNPQPEVDPESPVDRLGRTAPRSNPATPLTQPPYPKTARVLGQEGTAIVAAMVNDVGEISQVKLVRSTGAPLLDSAALEETRNWHLLPGTVNGQPSCMWGRFAVIFKLEQYTADELARTNVSAAAEKLASVLLGIDRFERSVLTDMAGSPTEKAVFLSAKESFIRHPVWLSARRRVAAMLSIEFTAAEIEELTRFYTSPLAGKLNDLQNTLVATVAAEERIAMRSMFCTFGTLAEALKRAGASEVFAGEQLSPRYAELVPKFVEDAARYCNCGARHVAAEARGLAVGAPDCGPPPNLE